MSETENVNGSSSTSQNNSNSFNDPYVLGSANHLVMTLTNITFNGTNFLRWSKQIKRALGAKYKLGFLIGTISIHENEDSNDYQCWGSQCGF